MQRSAQGLAKSYIKAIEICDFYEQQFRYTEHKIGKGFET